MNRKTYRNPLICACLAVGSAALTSTAALPEARADDVGGWLSEWLWVDFKKPNKTHGFQIWLDLHQRAWGTNNLFIFRPGIGYEVGKGITLWAGYAFIPSLTAGTPDSNRFEHRIWEQAVITQKVKTVALQGRVRLEQRFRQDADGVGERLRLFGRAGFFFGAHTEWGWAVWDEALFNLNTTPVWNEGFDQNRAFTGPFFHSKSGVRVEFGYMNYLVNRKDVGLYDSHVAMINLFFLVNPFQLPKQPHAEPPIPPPPVLPPDGKPPETAPGANPSATPGSPGDPAQTAPPPATPEVKPMEQRLDPGVKTDSPSTSSLSPNVASDLWDAP